MSYPLIRRLPMKKLFALLFLAATLVSNAAPQSGRRGITPPPLPPAPTLSEPPIQPERTPTAPAELRALPEDVRTRQLKSLDKGSFTLSDFQGKVLVINLWASWCGPCRREAPEYEKVRKAYAGRAVEFIGLTTEDPRMADTVNRFLRDVKYGFRLGWADH